MVQNIFKISFSGKALAFYREKAGFTQEELAEKLKTNRVTLANWEKKDKITLKDQKAMKLLSVLNVVEKELTSFEGNNTKGSDILDDPLVKSYVEQINLQREMIEILKGEIATLKRRLGE